MRTTAPRLAARVLLAGSVLLGYALPARAGTAPNVLLIIGDDPSQNLLYRWCIEGRFKLILTYDGQVGRNGAMHPQTASPVELYDLEADPFETENVAGAHPEIVARLAERIGGWWPARWEPCIRSGPALDGVN